MVKKLLIKLQKSHKVHHGIIQRQLKYTSPEETQKIIAYLSFLDNKRNQLSKFKTKNWVKLNDESRGTYDEDNLTRFKTSMSRSTLCNYSDAYILKSYKLCSFKSTN